VLLPYAIPRRLNTRKSITAIFWSALKGFLIAKFHIRLGDDWLQLVLNKMATISIDYDSNGDIELILEEKDS
jgi:hypothetical protein